ncbi:MAG: CBS domain-containing protein [Halobacteriota archaeon]|nr:CBS domain-containing protein [Halobacteriota archaeon]
MELTPIQKEILTALISIFRQTGVAVRGEDIAKIIDRNPGTVRNQMQSLKTLGLVEGVPGPKGGYKATKDAYDALSIASMEEEAEIPVSRNGKPIEGVTVDNISLKTLRHPVICNASIRLLGNIREFNASDIIEIGPTPVNKLVIRGEIVGRDDTESVLLCKILEMISLPKKPVIEYMSIGLVTIPANASIHETSRILLDNNIRCAPIMEKDKIVGIASFRDVGKALANGRLNAKIKDFAKKEVVTIEGDQSLFDAVKLVNRRRIGSLVVTVDQEPEGIITKSDILKELVSYH